MKHISDWLNVDKLIYNKNVLRIGAVLVAIFCWLVVAITISPTVKDTKAEVPVNIDMQAPALTAMGLNVIEISTDQVTAVVEGPRSVVGRLQAEDLTATAQIPSITEPGTHELKLIQADAVSGQEYEIVSYSPSTITVKFDRLETRSFEIRSYVDGLSVAAGYVFDSQFTTPQTVTITGPEAELDRIDRCVVRTDLSEPLQKNYAETLPIILEDVQGNEIDPEEHHLELDQTEAQLVVRVLKEVGLPLEIGFINYPSEFVINDLEYTMSNDYILIAGPEEVVDKYREIMLGYIDMKDLTPSRSVYSFDVELPTDCVNLDNISTVTVRFDISNWGEASFNVDELRLLNVPTSRYDITLLTDTLYGVEFVGDAEILELMTAEDIVAEIDLSEKELTVGQGRFPVTISAPNRGAVWAVGDYTVVLQVSEKQ